MDISLRGLAKTLALPPGILIVLLFLGLVLIRKGIGRFLVFLSLLLLYAISIGATTIWLASHLETYPATTPAEIESQQAQAILVLLADMKTNNPELDGQASLSRLSLERMDYAVWLHRRTGLPLILSGGVLDEDEKPIAELARDWLAQQGIEPLAIENESGNTWENLVESTAVVEKLGLSRVVLATHAWHMKRAVFCAERNRLDVIPAPLRFMYRPPSYGYRFYTADWMPRASAITENYLLLHEHVGNLWYRQVY